MALPKIDGHPQAAKLKLTKSNAHRVLRTLVALGYVEQHEDGNYGPTLKAWELGNLLISRLDFVQVAKPHLRRLNETTGSTMADIRQRALRTEATQEQLAQAPPSTAKSKAATATPIGCQRPSTTMAIARKPRPAVIRSAKKRS